MTTTTPLEVQLPADPDDDRIELTAAGAIALGYELDPAGWARDLLAWSHELGRYVWLRRESRIHRGAGVEWGGR